MPLRIGIMGDFNPGFHSHLATNEAIAMAADALSLDVRTTWLPTGELARAGAEELLTGYDGLWAAPGSPYQSMEGMLAGIRFARTQHWPFTGT